MKTLTGAILTAALLAATPAMADRGYDDHRGPHHHWKHDRHAYRHHYGPPRYVVQHVYYPPRVVYRPAPVYYAPPAPAGISIVLPDIFIPIR